MYGICILLFLFLVASLFLSLIKRGRYALFSKLFRWVTVVGGIAVFTVWFIQESFPGVRRDTVGLQVVNKLPTPLDIYVIRTDKKDDTVSRKTKHLGIVRPDHFRIDHMRMDHSNEYWVVGYMGKKNLVYFSQHSLPNKNIDQVVEINNYLNQSQKLSKEAKSLVDTLYKSGVSMSIVVTMCFLLIFMNLVLLLRKK